MSRLSTTAVGAPVETRERQLGITAVLCATLFWSVGGVLGKSTHAQGTVVTFWRMWMATALLVLLAAVRSQWPTWPELRRCTLAGVLFGLNICVFFTALERITVANALVIAALAPVLMLPIAVRVLGEHLTALKVGCAAVAVAAVVVSVLAAPSDDAGGHQVLIGSLLTVVALVLWVGYLAVSKQVRTSIDTVPFMLAVTLIGALAVSVVVAIQRPDLGEVHGAGWAWLLLMALGPSIGGHGLVAWAQERVDASVSTVLMQAEPVGASIFAYLILDERVTGVQAMAMGVVILALCVLVYRESGEMHEVLTTPTS